MENPFKKLQKKVAENTTFGLDRIMPQPNPYDNSHAEVVTYESQLVNEESNITKIQEIKNTHKIGKKLDTAA